MSTMNVLDAAGITVAVEKPLPPGRASASSSRPVALSNEDAAFLDGLETGIAAINAALSTLNTAVAATTPSPIIMSLTPKAVAVSQTDFILGASGAAGDSLEGLIIQPTGTTVGAVIVKDGSTTLYTYPGGTVGADLRPIVVPLGAACATAWKVTTPSNATVLALGKFT